MPEPPDTPSPEDAHPPPDKDRGTIPFSDFERPPERIGPYRILEVIGEGGMGTVYLAEQEEPIRRRVALKVIKLGMDTKEVVARFEAERQALAMMDHPNIAKVFDAGATEQGRPYFVMEYVAGEPITRYCDRHNLPPKDRLELLVQVCRAIQHAHQKGVIHRDIKASNVLVTIPDEKPVPKVIDFGVAKATSHRLTERTIFTEQGQLIGTPEYMSPEQAEMTGLNVDARTDIYSLGVLLYELLTGSLPFDPSTLRKAGLEGIQRMIREDEPPRPSTRISRLGDKATKNAQHRQMSVPALRRRLHGELDWVTMRAMAKDRARRYQSAQEFATDIERYLSNDPVAAGPPSAVYRLKKYVSKHRTRWVGVAGFLAIVASAVVITLNLNSMQGRTGVLTSPPKTIAIMPFSEVNTGSASDGSSATAFGLQILMRQLIEKAGPLRVIDSELIKDTRKRLEADSSQPLTDREITHALGADRMLQCELDLTDRSQMVNWRLTRPADGKLLAERRVLSKNVFEAATDIMGTLVPLLYAEIDSFPPKTLPSPSLLFTESSEAFLEYTRGVMEALENRMGAQDFRTAKAHFQKATDLDSTFALAALGWSQTGGGPRASDLAWEFRDRLGEKQLMKLQARRAFQSGRILESINIHQQILDRWPDDKMLYLAVTSSLWSWWFAPEAIQWAERGLRYYPDDEMLLRWRWRAREMIGQSAEAVEEIRIWLQAHPQSYFGWVYLGDLSLSLGLPDSAEAAYGRKMEVTAREQLWDTVLVAYHRGDVAGAVAILEAGIEDILKGGAEDPWSDPSSINLIVSMNRGLAQMLADIGRLEEALHWIDETATRNPDFGPTLDIFRRNLLMETGAFDRALNIEPLDASIQQLRDMPTKRQRGYWWRWEYEKVLCLEELGNRDEARKIGEQLLADPIEHIADGRLNRRILSAVLARMNEDFTSALDTLAVAEGDGIPYGHYNIILRSQKARTLKAAGRLPEAIEEWSTLLRLYRGYFPALYHRARVLEMAGQISRAREDYQDFLDAWVGCDPGFSIVKDAQTRLSNLD